MGGNHQSATQAKGGRPRVHWAGFASSVIGAKHRAQGLANQDSAAIAAYSPGAVAAVADGHSAAMCVRAARGSEIAVAVALELGQRWLKGRWRRCSPSIEDAVELTDAMHALWRRRVCADVSGHPLSTDEAIRLGNAAPCVAYGTTLIAAIAGEKFCVGVQIGDGQLLAVASSGVAGQLIAPVVTDGEASDSLCHPWAPQLFRHVVVALDDVQPAVLVCATDGYDKAFNSDADFLQIAPLMAKGLAEAGPDAVAAALPTALREASDEGSLDDVSCAVLFRRDLLANGGDITARSRIGSKSMPRN
jgi:hypothetical protein